jgi:hypothetical protein
MRWLVVAASLLGFAAIGVAAFGFVRFRQAFPAPSSEVVQLTQAKRAALGRLRSEAKFGPDEFPPIGYTGAATPEARRLGTAAVNDAIDGVLSRADGPIEAKAVSALIGREMRRVGMLDTEDRDRTAGYMIEVWYLLGFKGATGRFAYGAAFPAPPGYLEPLPPGWKSPTEPRPIS